MSYMEMIYIDSDNQARKTGVGASFATPSETWRQFNLCKALAVPESKCTFLLDYYNREGDLAGTIFLDDAGYSEIAQEPVLSDDEYRRIDEEHWGGVRQRLGMKPREGKKRTNP